MALCQHKAAQQHENKRGVIKLKTARSLAQSEINKEYRGARSGVAEAAWLNEESNVAA